MKNAIMLQAGNIDTQFFIKTEWNMSILDEMVKM